MSKNIAVILGYQLNLDSTMDDLLVKRLNLFLRLYNEQKIDYVIVSGGRPCDEIKKAEADVMYDYLVKNGIDKDIIIKEDKSKTTHENAIYSVEIAKKLKATNIIVVSTNEHFTYYSYNPVKFFTEQIKDDNITLMIYTNSVSNM